MTKNRSFLRKICYLAAIALLLPLLYWLGHPAAADSATAKGSPGGKLAQIRREYKLGQSQLGQIDPTSETIKLATFGLRPIAANILWAKAINYKMKKDWTNLSAVLNQLTKIQPHFIDVWRYQGWNLAYNCSVEFDDYRQRYRWLIKGIEFLKLGITYNEHEPRLFREIGWIVSQKIGRADEREQFRELFREDDDFHGARPKDERDNWLVGKIWYRKAENIVDTQGVPMIGESPLLFRSKAPMCQFNYAEALEEDGTFGEKAKTAWENARQELYELGQMPIPTEEDFYVHLNDRQRHMQKAEAMSQEIDSLAPDMREKILAEKRSRLTDEQRRALDTPADKRTLKQTRIAVEAEALLQVSDKEVAGKVKGESRTKALQLAKDARKQREMARQTDFYRELISYDHWLLRTEVEQTEEMLNTRKLVYNGDKALEQGNLPLASESFKAAASALMRVLASFPQLIPQQDTVQLVNHIIEQYHETLEQCDELFPEDFALSHFVQLKVAEQTAAAIAAEAAQKAEEALAAGDLKTALASLQNSLNAWRKVLIAEPSLRLLSDRQTAKRITDLTRKYAEVLKRLNEPFPDHFVLRSFIWGQVEHAAATLSARRSTDEAAAVLRKKDPTRKDLSDAVMGLERSLADWRKVLDKYPSVIADKNIVAEMMMSIDLYRQALKKQGKKLPDDFILQDVLDRHAPSDAAAG